MPASAVRLTLGALLPGAALVAVALAAALASPLPAAAQAAVDFRGLRQDSSQPIEVTADRLAVSQADGTALFEGQVLVIQGTTRMTAASLRVTYLDDNRRIDLMEAAGGVTFVTATDAAEGREAIYAVSSGELVMTGDVLLTQGRNTIAGERLVADLNAGTGRIEGRVRTVLQPREGADRN